MKQTSLNKRLTRLNINKGSKGKGLFNKLKEKAQGETHLVPFQEEENLPVVTKTPINESIEGGNGNGVGEKAAILSNMKTAMETIIRAISEQSLNVVASMKEKEWSEKDVTVRMKALGQLSAIAMQLIYGNQTVQGKPTNITKHIYSWEGMSLKELEDREEEMNNLLGRRTVTKRITIEERVNEPGQV